jgi:DNA-binding HxlR family transcriptional regulator
MLAERGFANFIKGKWTLRILKDLCYSPQRNAQLRNHIKGISPKVLHQRLDELEELRIIQRKQREGYPLCVEYSLNVGCRHLQPLINRLQADSLPEEVLEKLISHKWTIEIMRLLEKPKQASQLRRCLPRISKKVLFEKLHQLERCELIKRRVVGHPPRVEYLTTDHAHELICLLARQPCTHCPLSQPRP